jgi:hypothetical protein
MHHFEEDSRGHIFSGVAIKQPAHTVAKYVVIVHQVELRKRLRISACLPDQIRIVVFADSQGRLPLHPFIACFDCHRNYKRMGGSQRCKKTREGPEKRSFHLMTTAAALVVCSGTPNVLRMA